MADQIAIAAGEIEDADISQAPAGAIILAKDLTPSMTAGIVKENICQKVKNTDVICIDGTKIELACNIAKPV